MICSDNGDNNSLRVALDKEELFVEELGEEREGRVPDNQYLPEKSR